MGRADRPGSAEQAASHALHEFDDAIRALDAICRLLVRALGLAGAAVTVQGRGGQPRLLVATSPQVEQLIGARLRARQRPVLRVAGECRPGHAAGLASTREQAGLAGAAGISRIPWVSALPLRAGEDVIGTLHLCGDKPAILDDDDFGVAQAAATAVASCVRQAWRGHQIEHTVAQLQHALDARIVTEQAKGMIASASRITPAEAFERLRSYARRHNLRVHDVARRILAGEPIALDPPE